MELARFGVAMEQDLLDALDRIADGRGASRSEILRDLVRAEVDRENAAEGADAVGALTIVYDHHVRELTEKLTQLQHALGAHVRSSMHVHLSHDYCLEVIVLHGLSDELRAFAKRVLATRGVKRGGLEIISGIPHDHAHETPHGHGHSHSKKRTRRS